MKTAKIPWSINLKPPVQRKTGKGKNDLFSVSTSGSKWSPQSFLNTTHCILNLFQNISWVYRLVVSKWVLGGGNFPTYNLLTSLQFSVDFQRFQLVTLLTYLGFSILWLNSFWLRDSYHIFIYLSFYFSIQLKDHSHY